MPVSQHRATPVEGEMWIYGVADVGIGGRHT